MRKPMPAAALMASLWILVTAHVGSPNVVFDGSAGPYAVRVIVRPPNVVPGLAEVVVTVADAERVSIRPVFWRTGVNGAPKADEAKRVDGAPDMFSGQVWLMTRGAYSVYVTVSGTRGSGTAIVPVDAFATARLGLSPALTAILVVMGAVLFAGLVTIVRAAAGESVVPPGEPIDARARRRANRVALIATPIFALLVFGGAKWWTSVDADYRRLMFKPPAANVGIYAPGVLGIAVRDTAQFRALYLPVVPDHGKMMHLFIVSEPDHRFFAHLHPVQRDSLAFQTALPPMPAGHYRLFGDLTIENGTSVTVTNTFDVPNGMPALAPTDSDDAWVVADSTKTQLANGNRLVWVGDSALVSGRPVELRFSVRDAAGRTTNVEPYLGMAAHAVVLKSDDSVFIHLHPMGTIATVAQQIFQARDRGDTTRAGRLRSDAIATRDMPMSFSGDLSFPYEFPKAGRYRVFVQVKQSGRTETGAFDVAVR